MASSNIEYDVIFIGSGPGGYVGAIRSAQLGFKTAVVEKRATHGGTCLNVGCIPSKALLESSELFWMAKHELDRHGINLASVELNLEQMQRRKEKVVSELTQGIQYLFKKNKIESYHGVGRLEGPNTVRVTPVQEGAPFLLSAKKAIVLATGSVPNTLPGIAIDEKNIVSSTGALEFRKVPKHLVVVGGGVIGLELGSVWSRLGSHVTVLEYASEICSFVDQEVVKLFRRILEKQGIRFITGVRVTAIQSKGEDQLEVFYQPVSDSPSSASGQSLLQCDKVLVATGRRPFSDNLGLENLGIKKDDRGRVLVDRQFRTSVPGVFAIGDLIPGPMLAHKAEEEGVAVAEILAGLPGHVHYETCPSVIYTAPEVAWVGKTEEELRKDGIPYRVGKFPFTANGRAKALGFTDGFVKILAHAQTDRILGGHIIGPRASELLGEIVVAMEFGGSSEDLARSFHAHPTLNEAIREASLGIDNRIRQM
ncbi:MAG: dihydrolipoyl dehydrogenase [Bdellovibrionaceae bacterium]|nr:dihydrolipoyl dehydrogenase [Pseudobdellovibrionaceae bacterium]MDW8189720.1 dihydrolipoyl dehydrogenase [Pseudobdellovibrionaceae bacterium]